MHPAFRFSLFSMESRFLYLQIVKIFLKNKSDNYEFSLNFDIDNSDLQKNNNFPVTQFIFAALENKKRNMWKKSRSIDPTQDSSQRGYIFSSTVLKKFLILDCKALRNALADKISELLLPVYRVP
jgi:hypothetical protein